jgi:hypothetical protein
MKVNGDRTAAWCRRALLLAGYALPLTLCAIGGYGDLGGYKQRLIVPTLLRSSGTSSIELLQFCWRKLDSWLLMLTYVPLFALLLAASVFLVVAIALQKRSERTVRSSLAKHAATPTTCFIKDRCFAPICRQVVTTQAALWLTTIFVLMLFQTTLDQLQVTFSRVDELTLNSWSNQQLQAFAIVASCANLALSTLLAARLTCFSKLAATLRACFTCRFLARRSPVQAASCAAITDYGSSLYGFPNARPVAPMQPMDAFKLEQKLLRSAYSDAYENANTLRCNSAAQPLIPAPQMIATSISGANDRTAEAPAIYSVHSESDSDDEPQSSGAFQSIDSNSKNRGDLRSDRESDVRRTDSTGHVGQTLPDCGSAAVESTSPSTETSPEDSGGGLSSIGGLGSAGSGGSLIRSGCSSIGSAFVNTTNRLYSPAPSYSRYQALRLNQVYGLPNEHLYECIEETNGSSRHAPSGYDSSQYAFDMHRSSSSHGKSETSFYSAKAPIGNTELHAPLYAHQQAAPTFSFNTLGHSNGQPRTNVMPSMSGRSDSNDRIGSLNNSNWSSGRFAAFHNNSMNRPVVSRDVELNGSPNLRHKRKRHRSGSQASQMSAFDFTSFQR